MVKNYLNPSECFVYRGHASPTTVAKFSPNGFWVASADTSGKVKVWSWDHPEHLMKLETPVFSGAVLDLDWDNESKKIVACGDGSGMLVKCFQWDTGNSVGEMVGHSKRVQSVTYKQARPFRIMTGAEDFRTIFFAGPPFKMDHSNTCHTNFVNSVRYAPNGSKIVSVGSDKKIQLYDGATGNPTAELANAHDGGIYSVTWSSNSAQFATASADKTVKIWNADSLACEQTIPLSADPQIGDAQVAVVWARDHLLSVSLNGDINILTGEACKVQDHQTVITASYLDRDRQLFFTGSADGVVCVRSVQPGENYLRAQKVQCADKKSIPGAAHTGKITGLVALGDDLLSVGWDDKLRVANVTSNAYHSDQSLAGQPVCMTHSGDLVCIVTNAEVAFYRGSTKLSATSVDSLGYTPLCVSLLGQEEVALGGSDNKTHIYRLDTTSSSNTVELLPIATVDTRSAVTAVAYSPAGDLLAIGDTGRQVEIYERGSWTARVTGKWSFHTSKVTCLAWSPSGNALASGSLDENIFIWNVQQVASKQQLGFAHMGGVSGLVWKEEGKLLSVGNDGNIVAWNIPSM